MAMLLGICTFSLDHSPGTGRLPVKVDASERLR